MDSKPCVTPYRVILAALLLLSFSFSAYAGQVDSGNPTAFCFSYSGNHSWFDGCNTHNAFLFPVDALTGYVAGFPMVAFAIAGAIAGISRGCVLVSSVAPLIRWFSNR